VRQLNINETTQITQNDNINKQAMAYPGIQQEAPLSRPISFSTPPPPLLLSIPILPATLPSLPGSLGQSHVFKLNTYAICCILTSNLRLFSCRFLNHNKTLRTSEGKPSPGRHLYFQSRDHSILHMPFHTGGPLEPILYL